MQEGELLAAAAVDGKVLCACPPKPGRFGLPPGMVSTGAVAWLSEELTEELCAPASMSKPVPRKDFNIVGLSPLSTELLSATELLYVYEAASLVPGADDALKH